MISLGIVAARRGPGTGPMVLTRSGRSRDTRPCGRRGQARRSRHAKREETVKGPAAAAALIFVIILLVVALYADTSTPLF